MSYLLINPLDFIVENAPIHTIPLLLGILKNENIDCSYINLNSVLLNKFNNDRNFKDYISSSIFNVVKNPSKEEKTLFKELISLADKTFSQISVNMLFNTVPLALYVLKNKLLYYNLFLCNYSYMIIYKALATISFFYSQLIHILIPDCDSCRTDVQEREFNIDISLLDDFYNSSLHILKDFMVEQIKKSMSDGIECVGIIMNTPGQFITGLYVCQYIKEHYNCHINIGGSFFNEYYNCINNIPELFGKYFDSISIKNNTETIVDIIKYIRKEKNIDSIPNILYYDNGLKFNSGSNRFDYNKMPYIDMGEISEDDFPLPELVFPVQASTSCYWRKCIFCDCSASEQSYTIKTVSRLVDEIEFLKKKYKTKYFYFWDNALHPKYLNKLSDELKKRKIKIIFSIYARFEPEFNFELLKKLRKSGLAHICWGLDSASQRVIEFINKGIKLEDADRILKEACKANIYNKVHLIFGHPTETLEEVQETIDFISRNIGYIGDVATNKKVYFLNTAILQQNRDYYKSLIKTQESERVKLINTLDKSSTGNIVTGFSPTCLLYLKKFSRDKLMSKIRTYNSLQKNKFVKSLVVNLFNIFSGKSLF